MTRRRAALALIVLAVAVRLTGFDEPFAVSSAPEGLTRAAEVVTRLGDTSVVVVVAVLAGLLTRGRGRWRPLRYTLLASVLASLAKQVVRRPRPPGAEIGAFAFPSAHAARSMALALALAALWRRPWLALLAVPVGLSRLVLGVHWPADVLGGWLLAAAVAGFGWRRRGLRLSRRARRSVPELSPDGDQTVIRRGRIRPHGRDAR